MRREQLVTNCAHTTHSMKFGKLTVNVKNYFSPKKNLYDALFSIANTRLKEKSA